MTGLPVLDPCPLGSADVAGRLGRVVPILTGRLLTCIARPFPFFASWPMSGLALLLSAGIPAPPGIRAPLAGFHVLYLGHFGSADVASWLGRSWPISALLSQICWHGRAHLPDEALLTWRTTCTEMLVVLRVRIGCRGPLFSICRFDCGRCRLPLPMWPTGVADSVCGWIV
ncbi:hypothetical protein Nepgr_003935 [Nepenthes gracilis]|uniref:Uncharacterized protein n=1 Tax=Nepenthes gracilis TaxID=150966 RepID=A0AAD3S0E9_NEPGR|nr:hypothetical protein Nepgr_003935 [Nepenthes gracilis]